MLALSAFATASTLSLILSSSPPARTLFPYFCMNLSGCQRRMSSRYTFFLLMLPCCCWCFSCSETLRSNSFAIFGGHGMSLYVSGRREVAEEASRDSQRWSNLDQRRSRFAAADSFSFFEEDTEEEGFCWCWCCLVFVLVLPRLSSFSSCLVKYS